MKICIKIIIMVLQIIFIATDIAGHVTAKHLR